MARKASDSANMILMRFAGDFATAIHKIKEGSEAEGSAITLTQAECSAMVTAMRVIYKDQEKADE